jgi:Peptidase C13 family
MVDPVPMFLGMRTISAGLALAALLAGSAAPAQVSPNDVASAKKGMNWSQGRSAAWRLAQHQRLSAALAALKPQRPGVIDAYVVVAGMDADPIFVRESTETSKVLGRRYDALGRTLLLAAGSENLPDGSPPHLELSLAAVAAKMDRNEDVLVLYATAHGLPQIGLVYKDGEEGYGMVAPARLDAILDELGIKRRVLIISACFSGQFVTGMADPDSVIATASDDDRASFGCAPGNDWTYFGDALINQSLRTPTPFEAAANNAFRSISEWEFAKGLTSSKPRLFIGDAAKAWLATLEKRVPPTATARVGRPSVQEAPVAASR